MPTKSIVNVRCATYCELHTLDMHGLYMTLKAYPEKTKPLQKCLMKRIETARTLYHLRQHKPQNSDGEAWSNSNDNLIGWIKRQWRFISEFDHHPKRSEAVRLDINPYYCSTHLDLLALSKKVELKMQVICLEGSCPFVLEPNSSFRIFTKYVNLFAIFMQCLILPYCIAFVRRIPDDLFFICFLLDMFYFLDIYLILSTAIKYHNRLISKPSQIVVERLKDIHFLIDILGSIPIDYVASVLSISAHAFALLKLNRLLRIHRFLKYFNSLENSLKYDDLIVQIIKYCFLYTISIYWAMCLMYASVCMGDKCYYYGWFNYNQVLDQNAGIDVSKDRRPALVSLLYTANAYLSIAMNNNYQYTPFDFATYHNCTLLGVLLCPILHELV